MTSTNDLEGALSPREFCKLYSIGLTRFYAEVNAGRLRLVKFGRRSLVGRAEARRWFDSLAEAEAA
jgi:hypothetical protein